MKFLVLTYYFSSHRRGILSADPWLFGRIEVAAVDLTDAKRTAARWSKKIADLLSVRPPMTPVDTTGARERCTWSRPAADYWAHCEELAPIQPALTV